MQRLKTIALLLLSTFLLSACSSRSAFNTTKNRLPIPPDSESDSGLPKPSGPASFSATIDGQAVSGGRIDEMQQINSAYIVPDGDNNEKYLLFYLNDSKSDNMDANHSLRFYFPDKVGTYTIAKDQDIKFSISVNIQPDHDHLARYNTDTLNVIIDSITSTRVSGTFSGTFTLSPDTPRAEKKEVTVTEGKFDIPLATSKIIPS